MNQTHIKESGEVETVHVSNERNFIFNYKKKKMGGTFYNGGSGYRC